MAAATAERWRRPTRTSGGVQSDSVAAVSENRWRRLRIMGGGSDDNIHSFPRTSIPVFPVALKLLLFLALNTQ